MIDIMIDYILPGITIIVIGIIIWLLFRYGPATKFD